VMGTPKNAQYFDYRKSINNCHVAMVYSRHGNFHRKKNRRQ